jgi:hypothetical protein
MLNTLLPDRLSSEEVAARIKAALKDAGIKALITGARISAIFPDGQNVCYEQLELDTEV